MIKKETYLTCQNPNVFEGMTSISAIIKNNISSPDTARKIEKILYNKAKEKSKAKELTFLRQKASQLGFLIEASCENEINLYTTGNTHGGFIAFCQERKIPTLADKKDELKPSGFYALLDGIEDPYNFGYSVRSLYAAGVDGIILPQRNWMSVAGIVAKSSAGTSELIHLYLSEPTDAIAVMKSLNYRVVAAGIRNSNSMWESDMKKPILLIIGGEKRGISTGLLDMADEIVRIEYGREFRGSLSAASSATILAYEIFRQNSR